MIIHMIEISGDGRFQKLLEHLRYSASSLLSWKEYPLEEKLVAICEFEGSELSFRNCVNHSKAMGNVVIEERGRRLEI